MAQETASPTHGAANPAGPGHAVRVEGLYKRFNGTAAVNGASFSVPTGSIMALVGPSGCGKTTTLRLIAGFEQPDGGTVEIDGRTVAGSGRPLPPERRRVGMVFQDYALFPHMSVRDNIAFGLGGARGWLQRRHWRLQRGDARVADVLGMVGLSRAGERMPHELSGGEQQMCAIGRALMSDPKLLLMDEPSAGLAPVIVQQVFSLIERIQSEGLTVLIVEQNVKQVLRVVDRAYVLESGSLRLEGTSDDLLQSPEIQKAFMGM